MLSSRARRHSGFTLFEIVIVLMVVGVILAMSATITRGLAAAQRRSLTVTRLAAIDNAIVNFVAQQKRLPCAADGSLVSSDTNAGIETSPCNDAALTKGVVPWRSLGLTETEATDGWERRFTYRVQPALATGTAMNMSYCDPAGTDTNVAAATCNTACSSTALASCTTPKDYLIGRGLKIKNVASTTHMDPTASPHTGAAYVIISHGESGGGGYLNTGTLSTTTTTDGTEEQKNYNNTAYVSATSYYVDDTLNETAGTAHFDDIVSRPALLTVISKAGLGPRSHN
jgi:prepilin-type N-terminal cleavage/methylation domain-containing protein